MTCLTSKYCIYYELIQKYVYTNSKINEMTDIAQFSIFDYNCRIIYKYNLIFVYSVDDDSGFPAAVDSW